MFCLYAEFILVFKGLLNTVTVDVQVCDTRELSTSLRTSLEKVISWKFVSRSRCYSTKVRSVFVLCQNII